MDDKKTKTVKVKFHVNESFKRLKALEYIDIKIRQGKRLREQEVIEKFDLTQFFFAAIKKLQAIDVISYSKGYREYEILKDFEITRAFAKTVYEEEVRLRDVDVNQQPKEKTNKSVLPPEIVFEPSRNSNQNLQIFISDPIFQNPANIGVSTNDLTRFLKDINPSENTQAFIDAVMKVYLEASKLRELQQMIPEDKNELDKDDFVLDLLKCINSSNINEKDKISMKYYLESLSSLKVKYLKLISEKSVNEKSVEQKTIIEKADEMCNAENKRGLDALQEFVQNEIVPLNPTLVIGRLCTIDKAILWYIDKLKKQNALLCIEPKDDLYIQSFQKMVNVLESKINNTLIVLTNRITELEKKRKWYNIF